LLTLQELNTLRAQDLHFAPGDENQDRSLDAADIDLVLRNQGNANYDLDGDAQTNRYDSDYIVQTIFGTEYGDSNLDHRINALDFNALASRFGQSGTWVQGDFNGDGIVNTVDFTILAGNFGFASPAPSLSLGALIPEPTTLTLLAFGLLARCRTKRNRRDAECAEANAEN